MKYTFSNDFKRFGYLHLLPEFELGVAADGSLNHIRIAWITHELWISINKE